MFFFVLRALRKLLKVLHLARPQSLPCSPDNVESQTKWPRGTDPAFGPATDVGGQ
jgi:hypothetical protein